MCIGNTVKIVDLMLDKTVYPYVYREHPFPLDNPVTLSGLSLCV